VTAPVSVTNILTMLTFDNIEVHDNLFGPREGLAGNAEFWGVYVANSRQSNPTLNTLEWTAVPVDQQGTDFSVRWSLFAGLPGASRTPGDYYVFVRFVDGAGNVSSEQEVLQTQKITLEQNFSVPTLFLPAIAR
jgi:hypothetical protein